LCAGNRGGGTIIMDRAGVADAIICPAVGLAYRREASSITPPLAMVPKLASMALIVPVERLVMEFILALLMLALTAMPLDPVIDPALSMLAVTGAKRNRSPASGTGLCQWCLKQSLPDRR
jgi:hypothetical protein